MGVGVSAISYVAGNYFQNEKEMPAYTAAVRNGRLATHRGYLLSRDDSLRRDLIRQIMCRGIVNVTDFEKSWGISFFDYFRNELSGLETMVADGLVAITPGTSGEFRVVNEDPF